MTINPSIFKAYDIRGIYPQDINQENIGKIITGIYTFFLRDFKTDTVRVVLGRDMRLSSPPLFQVAKKTMVSLGATVIDIGLSSTPTFYFACLKYGYDCGLQISASHNPPNYNGIKFVKRKDKCLIKIGKSTGMDDVKQIVLSEKKFKSLRKGRIIKNTNVLKDEIEFAFKAIKPANLKTFKVVADPGNAMGILYLKELFSKLPCQLKKMNFELDGRFPAHQPDPMDLKNLVDLEKKVIEEKADLGIAPDGDGDRVFFVDEKGHLVKASLITSILAKDIISQNPGEKVLIDIRYIRNISNAVEKSNGKPIIGKVGHALITEHMIRDEVIFSGESSGHYFYRETGYAESSVLTILRLLKILSKENKPLSQLAKEVEVSSESGEYNFILKERLNSKDLLNYICKKFKDGKISWLDGLSVDYPSWRFNIRTSNTEPLVRLNVEAKTEKVTAKKLQELTKQILLFGAKEKK